MSKLLCLPLVSQGEVNLAEIVGGKRTVFVTSSSLQLFLPEHSVKILVKEADWVTVCRVWAELLSHDTEQVIALGGGKVLDVAKLACRLNQFEGEVTFDDLVTKRSRENMWNRERRLIAIPTTAGSGSEASAISVITHAGKKHPLYFPNLLADQVYLDSSFLSLAPEPILLNGIWDALVHAIESYLSPVASSFSKTLSVQAISTILPLLEKRSPVLGNYLADLQWAAFCAGAAQNYASVGLTHALAHVLESHGNFLHGQLVGFFIPFVLQLYASKKLDIFHILAERLKMPHPEELLFRLKQLSLRDWGEWVPYSIDFEEGEELIQTIANDPCYKTNPTFITKAALTEWLHRWCFELVAVS